MEAPKATTTKCLRGSRTEKCLVTAYLAESTAYTRYMYYAQQAHKEGYYPIERVFMMTANNEMHHAKIYFKYLEGGQVVVPMNVDAGVIGNTLENLTIAANEEQHEGVDLYIASANIAREEGFDDIAAHFEAIATIEAAHEERFRTYIERINKGTVWKRPTAIKWQCLVCGYIYEGTEPPAETCPACNHPRNFYVPLDEEVDAYVG